MNNIIKYLALSSVVVSMSACDDLFEPANENINDISSMYTDSEYADGILGSAYILMPYSSGPVNDVATDDAVSNDINNTYLSMAGGSWTSQTGVSTDNWRDRNASINYCNIILENVYNVRFAAEPALNLAFARRLRGEAFALRALNMYFLLQNYGGKTEGGELLGVPIHLESMDATKDQNLARAPFADCVKRIFEDVDSAVLYLPVDYVDATDAADIPAKFAYLSLTAGQYNRAYGSHVWSRMSGRIAEAVRAQTALLAASPAFAGSGVEWATAADYAANVIDANSGIAGIAPKGNVWYTAEVVGNKANANANDPEIIWRGGYEENCNIEEDNFPPTLYGKGRVNPTQNLVDAFPMLNGYPIKHANANYDEADPYANRDPRLAQYIITNGATAGTNSKTITTASDGTDNDALNKEQGYSTRTGYYMRKHLRMDCDPNSTNPVKKYHYTARIRYTEIYLAYAEAANEAWGPKASGSHAYTAYDVIKAIRQRAGIGTDNGDPYLEEAASSKESMRELIRNERRLELCFENLRFWDLRRWQANLNETAKGNNIHGGTYKEFDVEERRYEPYMIYGPMPYTDVLKYSNLVQNAGW